MADRHWTDHPNYDHMSQEEKNHEKMKSLENEIQREKSHNESTIIGFVFILFCLIMSFALR